MVNFAVLPVPFPSALLDTAHFWYASRSIHEASTVQVLEPSGEQNRNGTTVTLVHFIAPIMYIRALHNVKVHM